MTDRPYTRGMTDQQAYELASAYPTLDHWIAKAEQRKPDWSREDIVAAWYELQEFKRSVSLH